MAVLDRANTVFVWKCIWTETCELLSWEKIGRLNELQACKMNIKVSYLSGAQTHSSIAHKADFLGTRFLTRQIGRLSSDS